MNFNRLYPSRLHQPGSDRSFVAGPASRREMRTTGSRRWT